MKPALIQAKGLAGQGLHHVGAGRFDMAARALAPGKKADRRSGMAALILAANITPAQQEQLRDWLDGIGGSA